MGKKFVITKEGKVGIGTVAPQEALEINGAVRGAASRDGLLRIKTETGYVDIGSKNADWAHFITDRSKYYFNTEIRVDSGKIGSYNEDLKLCTSGVTRVTIDSGTGNVGIGTAYPGAKLHIAGTSDAEPGSGGIVVIGSLNGSNIALDFNEIMARRR